MWHLSQGIKEARDPPSHAGIWGKDLPCRGKANTKLCVHRLGIFEGWCSRTEWTEKIFKKVRSQKSQRPNCNGLYKTLSNFISTRVKAIGGFVQSCFISALPFVSLVALLRIDCRKTKVETGEHLGNYRNNLGGKLWRGSEWRWWEMFRCWICLWDRMDRISDGSDIARERGKSQGYLQSFWAEQMELPFKEQGWCVLFLLPVH